MTVIVTTGIIGKATTEETGMENIATVVNMIVVAIVERLRALVSYEQHETKPGMTC